MIPENLQKAVERFQAASQADPRIVAAFVGGSLATSTADEYSDLDLYLIRVAGSRQRLIPHRKTSRNDVLKLSQ